MKNQMFLVAAILCSLSSTVAQAQDPTTLRPETTIAKMEVPTKSDVEREIKRFKSLYGEAEKRNLDLDLTVVGAWTSNANSLEAGMNSGPDEFRTASLKNSYQNMIAFNRTVERSLNDADRMLVLECCHNIKDGKACKSLPDSRKKELEKCQKAHK